MVAAEHLSKGYGDTLLFDDLTFSLPRGGIVGVIGPNGAGKTTLLRMITGQEKPDGGTLTIGETVRAGLRRPGARRPGRREDGLGGNHRRRRGSGLGSGQGPSRAYVGRSTSGGRDQQKMVGRSGGERNRVHLAKLLKSGGNLILLDEPTNDLDVDTLRALEDALTEFAGCVVVVSHDRWFLDRICTHTLAFEGDSNVVWYEGSYRIRRGPAQAAGRGRRPAAPHQVPAADARLTTKGAQPSRPSSTSSCTSTAPGRGPELRHLDLRLLFP